MHHVSRLKRKNHVIMLIVVEKMFDKLQLACMLKMLRKLGIQVKLFNLTKNVSKNVMLFP